MKYVLIDTNKNHNNLKPITANKSIADIKIGLFTIKEKWEIFLKTKINIKTVSYLQDKYNEENNIIDNEKDIIYINSSFLPNNEFILNINNLKPNSILVYNSEIIATYGIDFDTNININENTKLINIDIDKIDHCWKITQLQNKYFEKEAEFYIKSNSNFENKLPLNCFLNGPLNNIFISKKANVCGVFFNTQNGTIIVDDNAIIMEGTCLQGNVYIGKNSIVKMQTQIYNTSIISNNCCVGGEIKNSFFGNFSNKSHYGYIGDSFIDEWVNLGAGTTSSNIKNNASVIYKNINNNIFSIGIKGGSIIGSYSKTAINTMLNTATQIGICCNIFTNNIQIKEFENFTWLENEKYKIEKLLIDINNWMKLKNLKLNDTEIRILKYLYEQNKK